ncbi:MAG: Fe-S cluster assembly protein SufD [Acidobacteriota bacterium]
MTLSGTVSAPVDRYLARFTDLRKSGAAHEPGWLRRLREGGISRVAAVGFPTGRDEEWKGTPVAPITRTSWAPMAAASSRKVAAEVRRRALDLEGGIRVVFLNGRFCPELSHLSALPPGMVASGLADHLERRPGEMEPYLSPASFPDGHVFGALNDAFFTDGAVLILPSGRVVDAPVHLLFLTQAGPEPAVAHPRLLVVAQPGSQVSLVETHAGGGPGASFQNLVRDLVLEEGAVVRHVVVQEEDVRAIHVSLTRVRQGKDSHLSAVTVTRGGGLVRNDCHVTLAAEGAECHLDGLYMVDGTRHADTHTWIDHAHPRTVSQQLYKGILDGTSRGVFFGRVLVRPEAQKVNARQTNKNLLISEGALARSTPQLEIHADEVQCRHGSAIGQLDQEMMFYLQSRGIGRDAARRLLVLAFAREILQKVSLPVLRERLESELVGGGSW